MSDQPETIASVLADYRADIPAMTSGELPHPTPEYLRILLDRIEAAAERKQASLEDALTHCKQYAQKIERENDEGETRLDAEEIIATVDNEFAGIRPTRAPGNAAAMREALESIEDDCRVLDRKDMWEEEGECYYDAMRDIREKVSAALASPARNCDRFTNSADARSEYDGKLGALEWRFGSWLFAPAEGGDHA